MQLNNQINGQNVYKSNTYIIRYKNNLNISVPLDIIQYCWLPHDPPYNATAPDVNKTMALLIN